MNSVYVGWLGHNNIGDEACYDAISGLLNKNPIPWDYPDHIPIQNPDKIIYGGGTILHLEYWVREEMIDPFITAGIPLIIWGSGVWSPSRHELSQKTKRLLEKAVIVGVRGPRSAKKLVENGIRAVVIGDPAIILSTNKESSSNDSNTIALNIGFSGGKIHGNDEHVISETKKIIKELSRDGFSIELFSMLPEDEQILEKIDLDVSFRRFNPSWKDLINFFKDCKLVIGEKLHTSVLSAAAGTPFISIAYLEKCHDFCESIDLEDMAVDTDDKELSKKVIKLVGKIDSNRKEIVDKMIYWKNVYKEMHTELSELF